MMTNKNYTTDMNFAYLYKLYQFFKSDNAETADEKIIRHLDYYVKDAIRDSNHSFGTASTINRRLRESLVHDQRLRLRLSDQKDTQDKQHLIDLFDNYTRTNEHNTSKYDRRNVSVDGVYSYIRDHHCTAAVCAEFFGVSPQTIRNRIQEMTEEQKADIKVIRHKIRTNMNTNKIIQSVSKEDVFEYMTATHCTYRACAEHFNVSRQTIVNRIKEMTEEQQSIVNRRKKN